ncbi:LLM class flavin-dependent oxidoreductase [Gordonia sp. NPDC003376]
MQLDPTFDENIPLATTAFGPAALAMAGRSYDAVVLRTFFSDETAARAVQTVKESAARAGRDPDTVQVWACFATVSDELDETTRLRRTVGRPATYLQLYGDLLVSTNRWDPVLLTRFRDPTRSPVSPDEPTPSVTPRPSNGSVRSSPMTGSHVRPPGFAPSSTSASTASSCTAPPGRTGIDGS